MSLQAIFAGAGRKRGHNSNSMLLATVQDSPSGTPPMAPIKVDGSDTVISAQTGGRIVTANDRVSVVRIGSQVYIVTLLGTSTRRGIMDAVTSNATSGTVTTGSVVLLTKDTPLVEDHWYELNFSCYGTTFSIAGDQGSWSLDLTNALNITNKVRYHIATGTPGSAPGTSGNVQGGIELACLWVATQTGLATMSVTMTRPNGQGTVATRAAVGNPMSLWLKDVTP